MATKLPDSYKDLNQCLIHPLLKEAVLLYGTKEFDGDANNPVIIEWAKEVNNPIREWYRSDSSAWCALYVSVCAVRAGYQPPDGFNALRAKSFAKWGDQIAGEPILGDILVFDRAGGGHVGLYVGEDHNTYHVLGGNQRGDNNFDSVCISRLVKERLITARRAPMNSCPKCCKRIFRAPTGLISTNEV